MIGESVEDLDNNTEILETDSTTVVTDSSVSISTDNYLTTYIHMIEEHIRNRGVRISRENITGYLLEKLAENKIRDVESTNGDYKLKQSLGLPEDMASKFLIEERRNYRSQFESQEESEEKSREKEYILSLSRVEKIKYYSKKYKPTISLRERKFEIPVFYTKKQATDATQFFYIVHLIALVFNIIVIIPVVDILITASNYFVTGFWEIRERSGMAIWNPNSLVTIEIIFFTIYLFTTFIFRNHFITEILNAKKWAKMIKGFYIFSFLRFLALSIFAYVGTFFSRGGITANYAWSGAVVDDATKGLILNILTIFVVVKLLKVKARSRISGLRAHNRFRVFFATLFYILFYRTVQIAMYLITIFHLGYAFLSTGQLVQFLQSDTLDYSSLSRNINYQFLFYTTIAIVIYFVLGLLVIKNEQKLAIKNRIRRQLKIQMIFQLVFNLDLLYRMNRITSVGLDFRVGFTFEEALISTLIYFGGAIILIILNRYILKVKEVKKVKKRRWRRNN